jgi:hypothetical protein
MKKLIMAIAISLLVLAAAASAKPTISAEVNGLRPIPGDPLSPTPTISITVTTASGPANGTIEVGGLRTTLTFTQSGNNYFAVHRVTTPLADGRQTITIEASDATTLEAHYEITPLYVQNNQTLIVQGAPLFYPNPFDPGQTATPTVAIGYTLSKPANVTVNIYDLSGRLIARQAYSADGNGGRAGYNAVSWDGRSGGGALVGNGLYVCLIVADGKALGTGKITVLKR